MTHGRSTRLARAASAVGALLALAASGCGPSAADGEIVVGAAGPFHEGYGTMTLRGAQLAIDEVNARGGAGGRRLRLRPMNDSANGRRAMDVAAAFVEDRGVVAVVGHVNSGAMLMAAQVYDGHLPAVATAASSPELTGASAWAFRVISNDSANALEMARYASQRGYRRAVVLYENDAYGRGLAALFRRNFSGEVLSSDPIAASDTDLEPFVAYYRKRQPDLVFVAGTEASGRVVLAEARRQGLRADFMGGDGWVGVTADTAAAEGAIVAAPFTPTDPRPGVRDFVAAFRKAHGRDPDAFAALGYDAAMTIARGIQAVGPDREGLRDWLAALDAAHPVDGVTGPVAFQGNGDRLGRGIVMTRVRSGALRVEAGS